MAVILWPFKILQYKCTGLKCCKANNIFICMQIFKWELYVLNPLLGFRLGMIRKLKHFNYYKKNIYLFYLFISFFNIFYKTVQAVYHLNMNINLQILFSIKFSFLRHICIIHFIKIFLGIEQPFLQCHLSVLLINQCFDAGQLFRHYTSFVLSCVFVCYTVPNVLSSVVPEVFPIHFLHRDNYFYKKTSVIDNEDCPESKVSAGL